VSTLLEEPGVVVGAVEERRRTVWSILRERPATLVGLTVLSAFVLIAILAPVIAPSRVHERVGSTFDPPSPGHPLGLDDGGIDILSLLMHGARASLLVGFGSTAIAIFLGSVVGIVAGYFGGRTDMVAMRVTDYFLVIPDVPLMIVIAAIWGQSLWHIILIIGLLLWTWTARVIRAQVKSVRERVYVKRARALGAGHFHTILRHVLPQIEPLIVANIVLTIAVAIFNETALAYLGLSDPSVISWGKMIKNATDASAVSAGAWWAIVPPGVCVALVILSCTLIGQALEDALNPRLRVSFLAARGFRIRRPEQG